MMLEGNMMFSVIKEKLYGCVDERKQGMQYQLGMNGCFVFMSGFSFHSFYFCKELFGC
jgi:hypothetical protein